MAEEQQEKTTAEMHDETLDVITKEFETIHGESTEETDNAGVEAESSESEQQTEHEDVKAPTYQEAEAAQQESSSTEDDKSAESEETVSDGKEREAGQKLDEDDAEVYGNLKPKAQERFEHWINRAKELETYAEQVEPSRQLHQYIQESTTNTEQLQWAVEVFRNLNSGDYDSAQIALKEIDKFADQIGSALGVNKVDNPEQSTYEDFEDLQNAVQNLEISEDWANNIASERVNASSQDQAKERFSQMQAQQYQQNAGMEQAKNKAYNDIDTWEQRLAAEDADYNSSKKEIMLDISRELASSNIPPQNWLPTLQQQYNVLSRGMSAAAAGNGKASKSTGPLAPGRSSGGVENAMDIETAEVTPEFLQAHLDAMHN